MPRDGSNIYSQPFPDVVEDTTIESTVYNGFTNDVAQDLNAPRPIVAGGTGAANARDAMIALSGEIAKQVVTNYDSYPFEAGSFYSAAGATAAPTANAFSGIVYVTDSSNMVLEARDSTTGTLYVRRKVAGVWGAWAVEGAADYVNVTGDTMTGNLTIQSAAGSPSLTLNKVAAGMQNDINGSKSGVLRWAIRLGNSITESGAGTGSNFEIVSHTDAGAVVGSKLSIDRSNGNVSIANNLTVGLQVTANNNVISASGGSASAGTYYFGSAATRYLTFDGTSFTLTGGQLIVGGNVISTGDLYTYGGVARFTSDGTKNIQWNGTNFVANGGGYYANGGVYATTNLAIGQATANAGTIYFGNALAKFLSCDGTNYSFGPGALVINGGLTVVAGDVTAYRSATTTGYYFFGNTGGKYLGYDGASFNIFGGSTVLSNGVNSNVTHWFANSALSPLSGIGTSATSINVYSNAGGTTGQYIALGTSTWTSLSDARLEYKKTARPLTALDKLANIQLYENEVGEEKRLELFAKAQELYLAFPHVVKQGSGGDDYVPTGMSDEKAWGVSYDRMGIIALQAVKELLAKVESLETRIEALETR